MELIQLMSLSTGSGSFVLLLDANVFSETAEGIATLLQITVFLLGIGVVLFIRRLVSNLPKLLETLPEIMMRRVAGAILWCTRSLLQLMFVRVILTIKYFWNTEEAKQFRYRIKTKIMEIKSSFLQKL